MDATGAGAGFEPDAGRGGTWPPEPPASPFCHQAWFYGGTAELLAGVAAFVRDGVDAGDRVLVVLGAAKAGSLRSALGPVADRVRFADMDEVGANPAWLIPLWQSFLDELAPGQRGRGVGEPVTSARSGAALAECHVHEGLLNVAFASGPPFWLLCPYDRSTLDATVLDEARRSHPHVSADGLGTVASDRFPGADTWRSPVPDELPMVPPGATRFAVGGDAVPEARARLAALASGAGMAATAADDFALAVHEIVTNSIRHGKGRAELAVWPEQGTLICDVRDGGTFGHPLAGRIRPSGRATSGRGLWMANRLCDLVQIRAEPGRTVVRLHKRVP